MSNVDLIPKEIISLKEARKILGKTKKEFPDEQLENFIRVLDLIARETIQQEVSID